MKLYKTFHNLTKKNYIKGTETTPSLNSKNWPKEWGIIRFKEYPRFLKIPLFSPKNLNFSLGEALTTRKSSRDFNNKPIDLIDLSQLLFYSSGIINSKENLNKTKRAYPSGGARYPLEIYLIVMEKNKDIEEGIYHYNLKEHSIEKISKEKELKKKIFPEIIWQDMIKDTPMLLIISAVFDRNIIKYKERGYRYILFEAGHLGQNIYLVSNAIGLKCCAIGGFADDRLNSLLDIDGEEESSIYIFALGH